MICTTTLYSYIDKGIFLHLTNKNLPVKKNKKRTYKKVKKTQARASAGESIEKRPEEIETREEFGHWEMDTVKGKRGKSKNSLLVLTERKTRDEIVMKLPEHTAAAVVNALDVIEKASKTKGNVTGIPTGFIDLDYKLSGLQRSDLVLIAARPSMGKTAFVLNIAQHVAFRQNLAVAIFSLEMSKEQLVNRLFSLESHVDAQVLRNGNLTDTDWEKLIEGAGTIGSSRMIIDDTSGISISEMRSKCRKYKLEQGLDLIIIDYLQLMSGSGGRKNESRQQEISEISRSLKGLARELNVPVIALSQLSRAVEQRTDKRPMLSDLRESGAIEQDADVCMFIYRDDYYNPDTEDKNIAEIIIAKQRNGPIGTVRLAWMPQYTRFGNELRQQQ